MTGNLKNNIFCLCLLLLAVIFYNCSGGNARTDTSTTKRMENTCFDSINLKNPENSFFYLAAITRSETEYAGNEQYAITKNNIFKYSHNQGLPEKGQIFNNELKEVKVLSEDQINSFKSYLDSINFLSLPPVVPTPENLLVQGGYNYYVIAELNGKMNCVKFEPESELINDILEKMKNF